MPRGSPCASRAKHHSTRTESAAVRASTNAWRGGDFAPPCRQRPRSNRYEKIGMLSRASTRAPQAKQCDGGVTTDIPRGMRAMHTLRKLPQMAPKAAAAKSAGILQAARYSARGGFTARRYHLVGDFVAS